MGPKEKDIYYCDNETLSAWLIIGQLGVHADIGFDVPSYRILEIVRFVCICKVAWNRNAIVQIKGTGELFEI